MDAKKQKGPSYTNTMPVNNMTDDPDRRNGEDDDEGGDEDMIVIKALLSRPPALAVRLWKTCRKMSAVFIDI